MNKRRFGRISLLVSASLAVLVAVQVWSLVNMYHARREEFSRQVMHAMTRAAYDDLLLGNKPSAISPSPRRGTSIRFRWT